MFSALFACAASVLIREHEEKSFVSWMKSSNQIYTGDEYHMRLGIWLANARLVQEHNAQESSYKMEVNRFAAMTPAEYKALLGFRQTADRSASRKAVKSSVANIDPIDWREKGAVGEVRDQGNCGSCWAFSAICGAEGCYYIYSGELLRLSESNLVDCCPYCYGCNGGIMNYAYNYAIASQKGKFMLEEDYPYRPSYEKCKWDETKGVGKISDYVCSVEGDENDLAAKMIQYGPTTVAIDASLKSFQNYKSGIYSDSKCSKKSQNHGVAVVGYGIDGSKEYWIIKNSYGASWGENGYIRMIKGKNLCGIANNCCVPIIY